MKTTGIAAAVLLLASALTFGQSMMKSGAGAGGTGSMMRSGTEPEPAPAAALRTAPSTGRKVLYTNLEAAMALAAKGPTVLFFAADWCPSCQEDLKDLNANGSSLGDITVVVVDYDKERELERRYGVTYQHTYVQIDSRGARLAAWSGGGVDGILARITRTAAD